MKNPAGFLFGIWNFGFGI